jgi:hypothetical protein
MARTVEDVYLLGIPWQELIQGPGLPMKVKKRAHRLY